MPVPIRDDGSPGPTRRVIVFVHGFNSSAATWAPLRKLLEEDAEVVRDFDLRFFDYKTGLGSVPLIRTLPTIPDAGKSLLGYLKNELRSPDGRTRYIDATLVGHSMGGLIIQSYLLHQLTPDEGARDLDLIRQVILFATPNFGSQIVGGLRRLASVVSPNPQEHALRLFSDESRHIHEEVRDRIIFAKRRSRDEYPLPFYCFSGQTDGVVPQQSAMGHFPAWEPLPGDHFTLHCPQNRGELAYTRFVDALRHPHGHPNVWEIERFGLSAKVRPVPDGSEILARHGTKQRVVVHDNVAKIVRQATFSANNLCREPYVLKYGTRNGGWVVPHISGPHITPADKLRLYDDNGCDAYYEVEPNPGSSARLELTVYKGFDKGHRDYHMHLGKSSYYRRIAFEVDVSDYRNAGWTVTEPKLYFHPTDPGDHLLCGQRDMLDPDPAHEIDPTGKWKWELEFVREGVIDIAWEVQPPAVVPLSAPTVRLAPGEHAIFGYGSLLSIASLERTLGRAYTGPFLTCELTGWRRRWNVAMPNDVFVYRAGNEWITPEQILYLNVEPQAHARVNGIIFVVGEVELARLDQREWIYDRVAVENSIQGVRVEGGAAWVYRGKSQHVMGQPASPRSGAIRRTYLDILKNGHRTLGGEFAAQYEATTDPTPDHLVIDDVRRDDV